MKQTGTSIPWKCYSATKETYWFTHKLKEIVLSEKFHPFSDGYSMIPLRQYCWNYRKSLVVFRDWELQTEVLLRDPHDGNIPYLDCGGSHISLNSDQTVYNTYNHKVH